MSRRSYEGYGALARSGAEPIDVVVRYRCQERAERLIVPDIVAKVGLVPEDELLEIGCGPGNLLIPLAFLCQRAVGIDHPDVLRMLERRFAGPPNIITLAGNFLDLQLDVEFDVIVVYAMLHYLESVDEALGFVLKAAALLRPGGRMLLGDLPNTDVRARFLATEEGQAFQREWERARDLEDGTVRQPIVDNELIGAFNDQGIERLVDALDAAKYSVELLEQDPALPFGRTRLDLLVRRPASSRV